MPLVNEVVLPLSQKDKWNAAKPVDDAQFLNYVTSPELAGIINTLYPVTDDIPTTNRTDCGCISNGSIRSYAKTTGYKNTF